MRKIVLAISILSVMAIFSLASYYEKNPANNLRNKFFSRGKSENIQPPPAGQARILFVGDMQFDRWIRQVIQKKGEDHILGGIGNLIKSADLVVGNLEGPITTQASVSVGSEFGSKNNYIFTFPPETPELLYRNNIRLVNLGNNHILNFGKSGLEETRNRLREEQVDFFGNAGNEEKRYLLKNIGGLKLAFLNYNQFAKNAESNALADLEAVREAGADHVIFYTHWGREYEAEPGEKERQLARKLIDRGADLVIGSHPHVVQTKEEYAGKTIYYSLGNFIFDQYFSPQTMEGLAVLAEFDHEGKVTFQEYRIRLKASGQTSLD